MNTEWTLLLIIVSNQLRYYSDGIKIGIKAIHTGMVTLFLAIVFMG